MKVFIAFCFVALASANSLNKSGFDLKLLDEIIEAKNQSYIVDGRPAQKCEFPSIVTLNIETNGRYFLCGGTIIDSMHVLTAAHCVAMGPQRITVSMGSLSTQYPLVIDTVYYSLAHPGFYTTARGLHNDVAVLTLTKPIAFTDCIKAMPLASPGESFERQYCITAGWGKLHWNSPTSQILRTVQLPIMPYEECHKKWHHIGHEHICTGDWIAGGASPCQGDSGGPLYCQSKNGGMVLAGVVSFGLQCAYGPAIYTNVAYFRKWIDENRQ